MTQMINHCILNFFFCAHWAYQLLHCLKWLKFHFPALEKPRLFAEFLMHIRWIIFLRPQPDFLRLFAGFNMYRLFVFIFQSIFLFTGYFLSICVIYSVQLAGGAWRVRSGVRIQMEAQKRIEKNRKELKIIENNRKEQKRIEENNRYFYNFHHTFNLFCLISSSTHVTRWQS